MPGMTAFVTILISEAFNVWKAQNAAFLVRNFKNIIPETPDGVEPSTHLAILRGKKVVFVRYTKGLVTATETQIISDNIIQGDKIIVGRVGQSTSSAATQSKRGGRPPM